MTLLNQTKFNVAQAVAWTRVTAEIHLAKWSKSRNRQSESKESLRAARITVGDLRELVRKALCWFVKIFNAITHLRCCPMFWITEKKYCWLDPTNLQTSSAPIRPSLYDQLYPNYLKIYYDIRRLLSLIIQRDIFQNINSDSTANVPRRNNSKKFSVECKLP